MPVLKVYDKDGDLHEYEADDGQTLWEAIYNAGVSLPHACGFGCQCGNCVIQVLEGHQNLSHLDEEEVNRCKEIGVSIADPDDLSAVSDPEVGKFFCRLSCACQVYGDVVLKEP